MAKSLLTIFKSEMKPGPGEFLDLDEKIAAEKWDIRAKAQARGAAGLPQHDSEAMDEVELEIANAIRAIAAESEKKLHDHITSYAARLEQASRAGNAADMEALARQSVGNFLAAEINARGELKKVRRELISRERALNAFRQSHLLQRPANPPGFKPLLLAFLFIMFVIETFPNAMILGEGSEFGYIGGYAIAIIFSFLNLASGWFASRWGLCRILHRNWWTKLFGIIAFSAALATCAGAVLMLAHYRGAVESGMPEQQAAKFVVERMKTSPFAIDDMKSLLLIGMSLLFGIFAMIEGWLWDDPYPRYGEVTRHRIKADQSWNDCVTDSIEDLREVEQRFVEEITSKRGAAREAAESVPRIVQNRKRLLNHFATHLRQLEDAGNYLLRTYYDANLMARGQDKRLPRRFNAVWKLEGFRAPEDVAASPVDPEDLKAADRALVSSIERLQGAFERAAIWIDELGKTKTEADIDRLEQSVEPRGEVVRFEDAVRGAAHGAA